MNEAYNMDCMEYMKSLPDGAFDLAVVDPPYGDALTNESGGGKWNRFGGRFDRYKPSAQREKETGGAARTGKELPEAGRKLGICGLAEQTESGRSTGKIISWDVAPKQEYFAELFRVSRNQVIWGGNYFPLPPTRCFLIWRKLTISESFSMAMAEYAWTSFNSNAKVFEYAPQGKIGDQRFHPTQKPVALYEWIFKLYAEPGMKILDTHLGSGSSRIAAWDAGLDFVGCEIDKTYFDLQEERFRKHTEQLNLFLMGGDE